eukprot:TRINITY_DN16560_c1_g3_i1.p1 TRINITY_DN16560_c1_g3~~TRINITY_DN16560_c1_g3_i1.p1  ORF type:complete len:217 (-),score=19.39 TRINITY_DN16560_c1_g3_i1:373-1023(-)
MENPMRQIIFHQWDAGSHKRVRKAMSICSHILSSSFCVAYFYPNIATVLRSWATNLLQPGRGLMCLVDIAGLFSAHGYRETRDGDHDELREESAIERQNAHALFRQADMQIVETLKNDVFAGSQMLDIVRDELADILEVVSVSEWSDRELAFDGKATPDCVDQWKRRLGRPGIKRALSRLSCETGRADFERIFLDCLRSEKHYCRSKVRMLILRRI